MAKILIVGASGFIGKRLVYKLLQEGHEVYAMVRIKGVSIKIESPKLHILYIDLKEIAKTSSLPEQIDVCYYLAHSMGYAKKNLVKEEKNLAFNFLSKIEKTACKQIIFLSGIIENEKNLSPHLEARLGVEKTLSAGKIPVTIIRSSIIIGSGSASFEIIRDLTEKLPIMIAPKWLENLCQPVAIRDVLFYLSKLALNTDSFGKTYDIGGPTAISFREALLRYARLRKLKRFILPVPVMTPKLSSYWLVLICSVPFSICNHLVESLKHNSRKCNHSIDDLLPHTCLSYEEALSLAFQKIEQNEVVSTWIDAWDLNVISPDLNAFIDVPKEGCLKDIQKVPLKTPLLEAEYNIWSIGGSNGWYSMDWSWKIRGFIDRLVGGAGMNRGRRHPFELERGDCIDFWRVILADKKSHHLILYAQMKLPGEAWLEFLIDEKTKELTQTATFRPKGLLGRIYWYACLPFHWIIFKEMAKTIASRRARPS